MRGRGEAGESLLEVLATVTVLAVIATSILAGIGTAVRVAGDDGRAADAVVVLTRAAEAVKGAGAGWSCAASTPSSYDPALASLTDLPPGWSTADVDVTSVRCVTAPGGPVPEVTVQATPPGGGTPQTIVVVPR